MDDPIRPVISDKVITVYKNGHGIHEVIAELQKGARELERRERQQRSEDATYENEKNSSMQTSQKKETK